MSSFVKNEQEHQKSFVSKGTGQRKSGGIGGHQNRNNQDKLKQIISYDKKEGKTFKLKQGKYSKTNYGLPKEGSNEE